MKHRLNVNSLIYKMICLIFPLFLLSCSSSRFPNNGVVHVPDDCFGIVHSSKYDIMDEMGAVWTLRTFNWSSIEREKGRFDFSGYDAYVDDAKRAGKKVVAVLAYQTDWIFPEGKSKKYIPPAYIPDFLNYIEQTVKHYRDKVDVWNIWNEPNIFFWKGSDREFYELSRLTAQKIRETDPDACIIGGAFMRTPKRFINKMYKAGGMNNLDGLAFHPYARNPEGAMRLHGKFTRIISGFNFEGDVWITEIGHPTGGLYPHKTTLEKLPSYVVKSLCGVAARDVRATLWYQLFDHYNEGEVPKGKFDLRSSEHYFGLLYPNLQRKDAAHAYGLCGMFIPGSRYTPGFIQRENVPSSIVFACFLEGKTGENTLVLWNDRKQTKKMKLYLEAPATLYDITTGKGQPLTAPASLEIGKQPLMITWRGTDVPRLSMKK